MSYQPVRLRRHVASSSEEGVAGVITAALVVAMLSLIISAMYTLSVPVWIENSENHHAREVGTEFTQMRNGLEAQVRTTDPFPVGHRVTLRADRPQSWMGVSGEVITGSIGFSAQTETQEIISGTSPDDVYGTAKGAVYFTSRNQQYPNVRYIYENGAVLRYQEGGDSGTMFASPPLSISNTSGGERVLVYAAYTMVGDPGTVTGAPNAVVRTTVQVVVHAQLSGTPEFLAGQRVNITIVSDYAPVWESFLVEYATAEAGLTQGTDFEVNRTGDTVVFSVEGVNQLQLATAVIKVEL